MSWSRAWHELGAPANPSELSRPATPRRAYRPRHHGVPMPAVHRYRTTVRWTGNLGEGTATYRGYRRDHTIEIDGKPVILGSSGLSAGSDPHRHNPEDLLVGALSACHMLWYLHLCAEAGVSVASYTDEAEGTMEVGPDGGGRFVSAVLHPHVVLERGSVALARSLHERAHERCFIASSVNFPVTCEPRVEAEAGVGGRPPTGTDGPA